MMKKLSVLWLLLFCSAFAYAQNAMVLDDAIRDSVDFFSSSLRSGSTVAVTNFEAETKELSDFIIQELLVAFANKGKVRVVERSRMEMLEKELNFNMSGSVSDETAQGIGHMIGAQILFSGSISEYRDMYRMRVQAIVVETAEIIGTRTINIKYDPTLTGLLGKINPADLWKYRWFYAGINVGKSEILDDYGYGYYSGKYSNLGPPIGYAVYAIVQPFDLFGIAFDVCNNRFGTNISLIPTLTLRPGSFEIDVFTGIGISVLTEWDDLEPGDIVYLGGIRAGFHLGPGLLYAEVRPMSGDKGFFLNITGGYQIGFIPRKK
jgi:hypothetical protein